MSKRIIVIFILVLIGCASSGSNEFDAYENAYIKIDEGLFYIKEVAFGREFESSRKVKLDWENKASDLCRGKYESLIYQDIQDNYLKDQALHDYFPFLPMGSAPVSEGVVLCNNSPYDKDQAKEILIRELYIIKQLP